MTIRSGVSPFANSGASRILTSATDNTYGNIALTASVNSSTGTVNSYQKTGLKTATLNCYDSGVGRSLIGSLTFSTATTGTFKFSLDGVPSCYQTGSFRIYAGTAPDDLRGRTFRMSIQGGISPFASSGNSVVKFSPTGSTYKIYDAKGTLSNAGDYVYKAAQGSLSLTDSQLGSLFTQTLSWDTATKGAYALRNTSGAYQGGTFEQTEIFQNVRITKQPSALRVDQNASATFSVEANGTGVLSYQWRKEGVNIAGATAKTLVLNSVQGVAAGNYDVVLSNEGGSTTSTAAILEVNTAPSLKVQPVSGSVGIGASTTFKVETGGTGPLKYQWSKDGTSVPGATSATYTITSVKQSDAGSYTVTVTNAVGKITSNAARLSVGTAPSITVQPVGDSLPFGSSTSLRVVAAGSGPLTYQWSKDGRDIPGASSATLVIPSTQASNAGSYKVKVSNSFGSVDSSAAALCTFREIATIVTSAGTMEFELFQDVSPRTVANFKYLADTRFYDGTAFHRLIPGFMIQGGCPNTRNDTTSRNISVYGQGGPEYTIPDEPTTRTDRRHVRGLLSMAKTGQPNSGGSQFFVMFGDAPWLDNVHSPIGFLIDSGTGATANSGSQTLTALEANPRVSGSDTPTARLVVNSIRIRSEIVNGTPKYQAGTVGGLLRPVDRSQNTGKYSLTLNASGSFTGRFQYWGRTGAFTGNLPLLTAAGTEKEAVVVVDSQSVAPLNVHVRVRHSASLKNSVSIAVYGRAKNGSDIEDVTQVVATSELAAPSVLNAAFASPASTTGGSLQASAQNSLLSTRYNIGFYQAISFNSSTNRYDPALPELRGNGFLSLGINSGTGGCTGIGKLADNRVISFSDPISNEGGRMSVSMCYHETPYAASAFTAVSLGSLAGVAYNFRLSGVLELPKNNSVVEDGTMKTLVSGGTLAPYTSLSSYLFWQQGPRPTEVIKTQIDGAYLLPTVTAWRAPAAGTMLNPFTTGKSAQFLVDAVPAGTFQVSNTNAVTFSNSAAGTTLIFDAATGTFSGKYKTKDFQGVMLQPVGPFSGKGVGFSQTDSASVPVLITP